MYHALHCPHKELDSPGTLGIILRRVFFRLFIIANISTTILGANFLCNYRLLEIYKTDPPLSQQPLLGRQEESQHARPILFPLFFRPTHSRTS